MDKHSNNKERRFVDDYDDKIDDDSDNEYDSAEMQHDDYTTSKNIEEQDDGRFDQHSHGDGEDCEVLSSVRGDQASNRARTGTNSEGGQDTSINLSVKDEHRLLGAFLLAADGGLHGGLHGGHNWHGIDGGTEPGEEPCLSTHAPTCLKKFTTIAASLGLKTTREKLREDFEKVVISNGLVRNTHRNPWQGARDTERPVVGFTYKVFRRYYLDKIQGELLEVNIREAWKDLHHGTGGKVMGAEPSSVDFDATPASATASESGAAIRREQHQSGQGSSYRGRSFVTRAELQKILTTDGEALTDEEVDELLRECRPDQEGRIVYEGYRRMLIDPSL